MIRVLVIGDIIIDHYIFYNYKKQCPDRPNAPAYYQVDKKTFVGGAANVALNLAELLDGEGIVYLLGSVNDEAKKLIVESSSYRINVQNLLSGGEIIEKTRIFCENEMMMRLDNIIKYQENTVKFFEEDLASFLRTSRISRKLDAIVVSDYAAGLFTENVMNLIADENIPLFIDTKEKNLRKLRKPFVLKLNEKEYSDIGMIDNRFPEFFCENCIVTDGAKGASLIRAAFNREDSYQVDTIHLPIKNKPKEVIDTSGCGDTFLAGLVYSSCKTNDIVESIEYANKCASSIVSELGTSCVRKKDIK